MNSSLELTMLQTRYLVHKLHSYSCVCVCVCVCVLFLFYRWKEPFCQLIHETVLGFS
jgi:hypothetical protein